MIWVIDASVAVKWFLDEESDAISDLILESVIDRPENYAVPELFAFEVYSVLQKLHPDGINVFINGLLQILEGGILRHPMTADLATKADYYVKSGLTGYDACYAALAKDLKGFWLTYDKKAHKKIEIDNVSFSLNDKLPQLFLDQLNQ
ncbi:MAG: type II toxin-antitoxin system VapC family toxin [Desulfobacteraceae bacterium]|jgi:predicted nucleic acid-binding protein